MSYWLSKVGMDKKTIGFAFALGTPYTLKFLWSPLIDKLPLPFLSNWLGQRRAWLYLTQALLVVGLIQLGRSDPLHHQAGFAFWGLVVAFLGATQDIIIDAYRIEILPQDQMVHGTAMNQFGYRVGALVAGAGTVYLASTEGSNLGWAAAYGLTALLVLPGAFAAMLCGEQPRMMSDSHGQRGGNQSLSTWLFQTIVGPIIEFFNRLQPINAAMILGFVILYKVGDAMGQTMIGPMINEMGFSDTDYIAVNKLVGFWSLIAGTAFAAPVLNKFGRLWGLVVAAFFMILANFGFAIVGSGVKNIYLLGGAIGMDSFATGVGLTIFTTFLSELTSRTYTASQFALLSSLAAVARTFLTTQSGRMVEHLGWMQFYIFCGLAFLPSLGLLYFLKRRGFSSEGAVGRVAL
jgi:MFS transporter, PAT family, beta-lactamase induction signal transducer AmpG